MKDSLKIHGEVRLQLFDSTGKLKSERKATNIITNAGRQWVIDALQDLISAPADYIAIGTDNTAAAASQTTLIAEVARVQGALTQPDAHTDQCVSAFGPGVGTGTIVEVGRLDNDPGGTLVGRVVVAPVVKGAGDTLTVTYSFTYAAG